MSCVLFDAVCVKSSLACIFKWRFKNCEFKKEISNQFPVLTLNQVLNMMLNRPYSMAMLCVMCVACVTRKLCKSKEPHVPRMTSQEWSREC